MVEGKNRRKKAEAELTAVLNTLVVAVNGPPSDAAFFHLSSLVESKPLFPLSLVASNNCVAVLVETEQKPPPPRSPLQISYKSCTYRPPHGLKTKKRWWVYGEVRFAASLGYAVGVASSPLAWAICGRSGFTTGVGRSKWDLVGSGFGGGLSLVLYVPAVEQDVRQCEVELAGLAIPQGPS